MFVDLLIETAGETRARDLLAVLAYDDRLQMNSSITMPGATMAGVLHFLLFEELLKRSPTALAIAGEALETGDLLHIDHAAMATIDGPFTGSHPRGRHHLGNILEPWAMPRKRHILWPMPTPPPISIAIKICQTLSQILLF